MVSLPRFGQADKFAMAKNVAAHNAVSGIVVNSPAI
jgi:hypothetical protein